MLRTKEFRNFNKSVIEGNGIENKEDHGYVREHLIRIEDKIDGHVRDHAGGFLGEIKTINRRRNNGSKKESK
jgi:hypothetical protein